MGKRAAQRRKYEKNKGNKMVKTEWKTTGTIEQEN